MTPWDKLFAAIRVFPLGFAETSDIMKVQTILKEANPMTRGEALKDFFPQDHPAGGVGRAAVLHLPLRLRKERGVGLSLALDPLRAAVWDLAAAALDRTGRRLSWAAGSPCSF